MRRPYAGGGSIHPRAIAALISSTPPTQASRKPIAPNVRPMLPAPSKPSLSQPLPIANAWPGPREKPMAGSSPKLGESSGNSVQISANARRKPASPCRVICDRITTAEPVIVLARRRVVERSPSAMIARLSKW